MVNLIRDRWIPITFQSGKQCMIAPYEITGIEGEVPVFVQGARSDFQGSYIQFLIGLMQMMCPPENEREWRKWFSNPPDGAELKARMEPFTHFFEMVSGDIRFMQDPRIKDKDPLPIGRLLMEMPGENAEKNNTDHFLKRGTVSQICPSCAACALFTLQTNASFGGAGHRVGLRGGGPMSTLVKGRTLWELVWLNVLNSEDFSQLGNTSLTHPEDSFPWSVKGLDLAGKEVTPQDVHPNQMFWGMPRRIFLNAHEKEGYCDLCGLKTQIMIRSYSTEKGGIVYNGGWKHTLSPYYFDKKGSVPGAIHVQPGGISYRNWLGIIQSFSDKANTTQPAQVVQAFKGTRMRTLGLKNGNITPLWAFGYDMDKAKARCYYEDFLPIPLISEEYLQDFEIIISQWIRVSSHVLWALKQSIKQAWYTSPKNHPGDISLLDLRFWRETESSFYEQMGNIAGNPEQILNPTPINLEWLEGIRKKSFQLFDELSQYDQVGIADPKRIANARKWLSIMTYSGTKQVADILGLPVSSKKTSQEKKRIKKEANESGVQ